MAGVENEEVIMVLSSVRYEELKPNSILSFDKQLFCLPLPVTKRIL